jgi:hypothetical protein
MKKRTPPTLLRIVIEFVAIILLQLALAHALMRFRVLDHLLSPGRDSAVALGVTAAFLLLRMFVLLFAPGWFLARLWLWMSRLRVSPA